jgi:hypothetical protein
VVRVSRLQAVLTRTRASEDPPLPLFLTLGVPSRPFNNINVTLDCEAAVAAYFHIAIGAQQLP